MSTSVPAHPYALPGALHAPPGMSLPNEGVVDAPRPVRGIRAVLDIVGALSFVLLASILCTSGANALVGGMDGGWARAIAWQSCWLVAAMLCIPLMPGGVRHDISMRSTVDGLALHWPELAYTTWTIGLYTAWLGSFSPTLGPVLMSLAVGMSEEMLFRVLLLGWLVTRLPVPHALALSAAVFGLAHLQEPSLAGVLRVLPQTAGGFVLGAVYLRTRNPIAPMLAHAYWDLPYFVAADVGMGSGSTSGSKVAPVVTMPSVAELVPWLAFCVYGLWLVRSTVPLPGRVTAVGTRPPPAQ